MNTYEKQRSSASGSQLASWGKTRSRINWAGRELKVDPNELIDTIVDAIDYAEIARDSQGLTKARRLLNNDLRQAIDTYVQEEVARALSGRRK